MSSECMMTLCMCADESQPNLYRGMYREELQEFIRQLLADWNIQDMFLDRTIEAVEFQYTYWPDPENRTARQQEFIHVRVKLLQFRVTGDNTIAPIEYI